MNVDGTGLQRLTVDGHFVELSGVVTRREPDRLCQRTAIMGGSPTTTPTGVRSNHYEAYRLSDIHAVRGRNGREGQFTEYQGGVGLYPAGMVAWTVESSTHKRRRLWIRDLCGRPTARASHSPPMRALGPDMASLA